MIHDQKEVLYGNTNDRCESPRPSASLMFSSPEDSQSLLRSLLIVLRLQKYVVLILFTFKGYLIIKIDNFDYCNVCHSHNLKEIGWEEAPMKPNGDVALLFLTF